MSIPPDIRTVKFPGSVRGYDRAAVDAYVERVNAVIAELEIRSSPRAAVRHALEEVGEQTSGILQRARETAEEVIVSARKEAEDTTAAAKAEAAEIIVNASTEADRAQAEANRVIDQAAIDADKIKDDARIEAEKLLARTRKEMEALQEEGEARLRELHADIASTWKERRELLDDVRSVAAELEQAASRAAARVPPQDDAEAQPEEPSEAPTASEANPIEATIPKPA